MLNTYNSSDEVELILFDFFTGSEKDLEKVLDVSSDFIRGIVKRKSYGLPIDIHAEIPQELYIKLSSDFHNTFNPQHGTAKQYLYGLVLNAIRKVKRSYGLIPGRLEGDVIPTVVSLSELEKEIEAPVKVQGIENDLDSKIVLSKADIQLRKWLLLIYFEGLSRELAAQKTGLSRFQLNRRLNTFRNEILRTV